MVWATQALGAKPELEFGSNDAGFPTSLGIPAVCVGGAAIGGSMHSLSEWFESAGAFVAVQRALLAVVAFDSASPKT